MTRRKAQNLAIVVGNNISWRRKRMELTQAELAEQLNMGSDSLSRIENGIVAPRFQRLEDIAKILDCTVADLFRKGDEPLSVKLDTVQDMLRLLPPDAQEDIICLMMDLAKTIKKRLYDPQR